MSEADVERICAAALGRPSDLAAEVVRDAFGEDGRWRIPPLGVRRRSAKQQAVALPEAADVDELELGELCELLPGRNRVAKGTDKDPTFRVIRAVDIGTRLTDWTELPDSTPRKVSSAVVLPGDVVGSISPPHGRWALVPEDYGPALASDHTVVLRKRGDISMWYLLGYLRSDRGRRWIVSTFRGTIPRIARDQLERIPVPWCPINSRYVDRLLQAYSDELRRLEAEVGQLQDRLNQIYDGDTPVEIAADLDALQGVTASIRSVTGLNSALRIAKSSFPYPISRTLRAMDQTVSPRARYQETVHEGLETITNVLTALCAAVARSRSITGRATKTWADSVGRSGATIGVQRTMVLAVAAALLDSVDDAPDVGGLGQALGDASSPAATLTGNLLAERNRIHGDYPRSDYQFQQRLVECEGIMRALLDSLSFLARWELRYAESVEPVQGEGGEPNYSGTFRVLQGDNPDWNVAWQVSDMPLYRGHIYALVDGQELLDLYPFLLVRDCPQCGSVEVYYPDSYGAVDASLKSIDRGHSQVCTDERLLRDLRLAFAGLQ
jgi:hypothetical protein